MVIRLWLIGGITVTAIAWILTVVLSPDPVQVSPASAAAAYRDMGLLPQAGAMAFSTEIGHEVFEIPETDAAHAAEEAVMMGSDMPGMLMPEADGGEHGAEMAPEMAMEKAGEAPAMSEEAMEAMIMPAPESGEPDGEMSPEMSPQMAMEEAGETPAMSEDAMEAMAMPDEATGEHADEGGHGDEMAEMVMEEGAGDRHAGGFGLEIVPQAEADRSVAIEMSEWGFSPARLDVEAGETIRFTVRNTGNIPHEFMFMPPQGMAAVSYRLERADWNLVEHEALFEHAVVLPGDSFEVTIRIQHPGQWMFMCMFPYHMQFGMMGMMMTEGMNMEGMKM